MAFRGLFIGVNNYASRRIHQLRFAKRDATALYTLFTDTLGQGAVLLKDEHATRAAIAVQFEQLVKCDPDDVVVIAFSGHCSDSHELVTYDADLSDLPGSCISLDTLVTWFSQIPARRLICFLDCCFSGGMGAKVLRTDATSRSLKSADELLQQLSGDGRLILTASNAVEEGWEHTRLGHGFLTHFLLEALQGAEEVQQAGKISVYKLLEYVSRRVIDGAAQFGKHQHPTLRGSLDGNLTWPVFVPGQLYREAFPEQVHAQVTAAIQSLEAFGFPSALTQAWAASIPSLNQLQMDAINEFRVLESEHLIVSAPTSSGKTMIGELAALKGAVEHNRAIFLLPLKSLVNDKHQHFQHLYGSFGIVTIRATGEITDDIPALMRGQYDVCLMTYEKFAALVLADPYLLEQVGTVVVDEVQMIADTSRGANLEFILTLLRMRRRQGVEPQVVALSAVIGNTNGLEHWLGGRLLRREERPVPLEEGVLRGNGSFRYIDPSGAEQIDTAHVQRIWNKNSSQDWVIPLVQRLVNEGQQIIVFRETRGEARGTALYLARALGLPAAQDALNRLPDGDLSSASNDLRIALGGGVAFHTSNLDRDERLILEEFFRLPNTTLRVLAATTTLAMGINTPASAVIIVGLQHPGNQPYSIAEYKNMVGRAGRLGFSERGTSYLLALTPHEENFFWQRYVTGVPEDLRSQFIQGADLRSLILRVITSAQHISSQGIQDNDVADFLENSFGAYQEQQASQQWQWSRPQLMEALAELERHRLIERSDTDHYQVTQLGRLAGEGGVEVESVVRLVDLVTGTEPGSLSEPTLLTLTQFTVELDHVLFPLNKKSTQKEPFYWVGELQRQGVPQNILASLRKWSIDQHQGVLRAKKAVACLLWMSDWPIAEVEHVVTQFGGALGGAAGDIRSVSTRSIDLLPTVARVAELLHPGLNLADKLARLLTRLEVGVPNDTADLASYTGSQLNRADYQRLWRAGFRSIDAIEASSDDDLLACISHSQRKLEVIRAAVQQYNDAQADSLLTMPTLPLYNG